MGVVDIIIDNDDDDDDDYDTKFFSHQGNTTGMDVATHTERWRQTEHVAGRFKEIRRPAQPVFAALPNYASSLALH